MKRTTKKRALAISIPNFVKRNSVERQKFADMVNNKTSCRDWQKFIRECAVSMDDPISRTYKLNDVRAKQVVKACRTAMNSSLTESTLFDSIINTFDEEDNKKPIKLTDGSQRIVSLLANEKDLAIPALSRLPSKEAVIVAKEKFQVDLYKLYNYRQNETLEALLEADVVNSQ